MARASALAPDDPLRRRVELAIAGAGRWAEREWLDLLERDERLRIDLRQVCIPSGLEARLLAIPDREDVKAAGRHDATCGEASCPAPPTGSGIDRRRVAIASLALALACALFALRVPSAGEGDERLQTLALLAMQDHMNESDLVVRTSRSEQLVGDLSRKMGFSIALPDLGEACVLLGGRPCHLGSHLVALTLWKSAAGVLSLYQFRPSDFGLVALTEKRIVTPHGPAAGHEACTVTFWTEGSTGFALVRRQS